MYRFKYNTEMNGTEEEYMILKALTHIEELSQ